MPSTEIQTRDPDQLLVIIGEQDQEIEWSKEEIRLLLYKRFGVSQENINALQAPLFPVNESDYQACLEQADNDKTVVPARQRRKPKNRVTLADDLTEKPVIGIHTSVYH